MSSIGMYNNARLTRASRVVYLNRCLRVRACMGGPICSRTCSLQVAPCRTRWKSVRRVAICSQWSCTECSWCRPNTTVGSWATSAFRARVELLMLLQQLIELRLTMRLATWRPETSLGHIRKLEEQQRLSALCNPRQRATDSLSQFRRDRRRRDNDDHCG